MQWPGDWMKVKWAPGECCSSGGEDYLVPFNLIAAEEAKAASTAAATEESKDPEVKPKPVATP